MSYLGVHEACGAFVISFYNEIKVVTLPSTGPSRIRARGCSHPSQAGVLSTPRCPPRSSLRALEGGMSDVATRQAYSLFQSFLCPASFLIECVCVLRNFVHGAVTCPGRPTGWTIDVTISCYTPTPTPLGGQSYGTNAHPTRWTKLRKVVHLVGWACYGTLST